MIIGLGTLLGSILERSGGAKVLTGALLRALRREAGAAGDGRRRVSSSASRCSSTSASSCWRRWSTSPRSAAGVAGAVRDAADRRPVDHARVPAAAPRPGGRGRPAARRARLDDPDGPGLRHSRVPHRRRAVRDLDRQADRRRGARGDDRRRGGGRRGARTRRRWPGRLDHRGAAGADPGAARSAASGCRRAPRCRASPRSSARPAVALTVAVLLAFWLLGLRRGFTGKDLNELGREVAAAGRDDPAGRRRGRVLRRGALGHRDRHGRRRLAAAPGCR